jgi:hypothetical protein
MGQSVAKEKKVNDGVSFREYVFENISTTHEMLEEVKVLKEESEKK